MFIHLCSYATSIYPYFGLKMMLQKLIPVIDRYYECEKDFITLHISSLCYFQWRTNQRQWILTISTLEELTVDRFEYENCLWYITRNFWIPDCGRKNIKLGCWVQDCGMSKNSQAAPPSPIVWGQMLQSIHWNCHRDHNLNRESIDFSF